MPTTRLTVPTLITNVRDLGQQQAALDVDDNGRRDLTLTDVSNELRLWEKSGREANDAGVIRVVERYRRLSPRTKAKIEQAYLDGYSRVPNYVDVD